MGVEDVNVRCCVVGGGPAGMMLGYLLARAGVEAMVLEKHADFFRDFRGDTIHPSTLEILHDLGLLDAFLRLPHQETRELKARVGGRELRIADFANLPIHARFLAFAPQWDFLDFLAKAAGGLPGFGLRLGMEATGLILEGGEVRGVRAATAEGPLEIRADLVVAADGRHSLMRREAGLEVMDIGAPMDVLWFRLPRRAEDPAELLACFEAGRIMILIDRGDYWQCGYIIAKGGFDRLRGEGLPAFQERVAATVPFLRERVAALKDWEEVKLLTVAVDRLRHWQRPGFLCIGDAAHAMSPIGGVGINLAIQDAVAAANILAAPLRAGRPGVEVLAGVQRRREFPTRVTQGLQVALQNRVVNRVLGSTGTLAPPWPLRLLDRFASLRRLPARVIGLGVRPEHPAPAGG